MVIREWMCALPALVVTNSTSIPSMSVTPSAFSCNESLPSNRLMNADNASPSVSPPDVVPLRCLKLRL